MKLKFWMGMVMACSLMVTGGVLVVADHVQTAAHEPHDPLFRVVSEPLIVYAHEPHDPL